jgi:D-alanyl-lipoteichoic acid acyltransferase DltB (MBOAT superfamily)
VSFWASPITVGTVGFLVLVLALVVAAWTPMRRHFLTVLIAVNLAMLFSWLRWIDAACLLLFLVPPFLMARHHWGSGKPAPTRAVLGTVLLQIALFLVLRRYPGFDVTGLLGHPVAVIGVSYIMFRQIHLIVDAPYSTEPFSLARYFAYTTAVWSLLAGPIQRYPDFVAGLGKIGRPGEDALLASAHRITTGILKAFVLAPMLLETSKLGSAAGGEFNAFAWLVTFYSYFIFLYLDFSGYTDIVIGCAGLCGFSTLPENFNRPYLSRNVQEFWARWHISLGTWFRDYVFTPLFRLLGDWSGWRSLFLTNIAALAVTFLLVGAWHGPGLNFVAFGIAQAAGVVAAVSARALRERFLTPETQARVESNPILIGLSWLLCFHFICASFLLLENSPGDVARFLGAMLAHLAT